MLFIDDYTFDNLFGDPTTGKRTYEAISARLSLQRTV
jgi:hypothetical protein